MDVTNADLGLKISHQFLSLLKFENVCFHISIHCVVSFLSKKNHIIFLQ